MEAQIGQSGLEDTTHGVACVAGDDALVYTTGALLPWLPELHGFETSAVQSAGHANGGECHTANVHIASQPSSPADQAPRAHFAPLVCQPRLRCLRVRVPHRNAQPELQCVRAFK